MTEDRIDKALIRERFAKAIGTYDREASVQRHIAVQMCEMLGQAATSGTFSRVLEIGCGTGIYTGLICSIFNPEHLYINDICPEMEDIAGQASGGKAVFIHGDAETIHFPERLTLITSCSAIQWFYDLRAFFLKCRSSLNDGGMLAFSTFGENNLKEIRQITNAGLNYPGMQEIKTLLGETGFGILASTEENTEIWFSSPTEAVRHLKSTGVTATSAKKSWTKKTLESFAEKYSAAFGREDGKVPLTYHPIHIIANKN